MTLSGAASDEIGAPVVIEFLYSVYGSPGALLILVYRGRVDPLAESSDGWRHFRAVSAAAIDQTCDVDGVRFRRGHVRPCAHQGKSIAHSLQRPEF